MNFIPATVDGTDIVVGDVRLPGSVSEFDGRPVLVGVRAESIEVVESGGVPVTVAVLEPTGAAVLLTVELSGQELKVQAPASFRADPGATVRVRFQPDRMRLYDRESGLALSTQASLT
jgi:multiple sugar transport system ATP-binding protein